MKLKRLVVYAGVIMAVCAGSMVHAEVCEQCGKEGKKMGERGKGVGDKIIKELGLTAEQEKQIKEQREEKREKNKAISKKLGEQMKALKEELEKQDVDKERINAVAEEIKALKGALIDQRISCVLAMKQILTPEQYKKLKELRKKGHSKREKMWKGKKGKKGKKKGKECPIGE